MRNHFKEMILSSVITEVCHFLNMKSTQFLSENGNLFGRYADLDVMREIIAGDSEILRKAEELAGRNGLACSDAIRDLPLCSIFSNMSINGEYPKKRHYEPAVMSVDASVPVSSLKEEECDFDRIRKGLRSELNKLGREAPEEFESFLIVFDTVIKKYLWSIPAGKGAAEDISMYDFIKTKTAAVAALMKADDKNQPFIAAAGHFSGIQKYIFSVANVGEGGVAKRLRARSFYVNAMVTALAHSIIHKFEMPMMNIIILTGGKFYILLPNTDNAERLLEETEQRVSEYLYQKFKGNLSLELVWNKMTDEGLADYGTTVRMLSGKLGRKKNQRLKNILVQNGSWDENRFIVYHELNHKSMCKSCRSALVDEKEPMCANCRNDTEIGAVLPKIKSYSFSRNRGQYELLEGYYLNLDKQGEEKDVYILFHLNNEEISKLYQYPVTVHYTVNQVPTTDHGEIKTFSEIQSASIGAQKIGMLKADVDTLGFLFSEGLRSENSGQISVSRLCTLSRMLDFFFTGYLNRILGRSYENIYSVFAGGDDMVLLGPWDKMPDLALEINEQFHRYTGDNKCFTLSAAICTANGSSHIASLTEYCEQKLSQVKKQADIILHPEKRGRDGVYFLGETMTWEDLRNQIKRGKSYTRFIRKYGTSIFRRLGTYGEMYQQYHKTGETKNLMFLPLFYSDKERNYPDIKKKGGDKKHDDSRKDFPQEGQRLYKAASNYRRIEKDFYYISFCVKYALNYTRKERNNGYMG